MLAAHVMHEVSGQEYLRTITLGTGAQLLFGLQWTPLLGGRHLQMGRERARLLQATHYLVSQEPGAVLGYAKLTSAKERRSDLLYSAAMQYARAHASGTVACVLPHAQHGYWVVAAHEGQVLVQSDKWFVRPEQAEEVLSLLAVRFPELDVCWLSSFDASAPPEWLLPGPEVLSRLTRLGKRRAPKILLAVILFAAVVAMLFTQRLAPVRVASEPAPSAAMRWDEAVRRIAELYPIHTALHIAQVLDEWRQAPLYVAGWKLKQIQCESKGLEWRCMARYQREHRFALNKSLEGMTPQGWIFRPFDLDHAVLTWTVQHAAQSLNLTGRREHADWMNYLQEVSPAFESIQVGAPARLAITAPIDGQGVPLARPDAMVSWQKRSVAIKGPMRSIAALSGLKTSMHWRTLSLSVDAMSGVGIARSQLVVQLIGDLFETIQ